MIETRSLLDDDSHPRLARGCRLRERDDVTHVLFPEGVLKLSAGGRRVIALCDGARTWPQVIDALAGPHPPELRARIERETRAFLDRLIEKGVVMT